MEKISLKWLKENKPEFLKEIDKYLYNSPHYGLEKDACDYLLNMVKSKIKKIQYGVATDSDGCTYNGIIWED